MDSSRLFMFESDTKSHLTFDIFIGKIGSKSHCKIHDGRFIQSRVKHDLMPSLFQFNLAR